MYLNKHVTTIVRPPLSVAILLIDGNPVWGKASHSEEYLKAAVAEHVRLVLSVTEQKRRKGNEPTPAVPWSASDDELVKWFFSDEISEDSWQLLACKVEWIEPGAA